MFNSNPAYEVAPTDTDASQRPEPDNFGRPVIPVSNYNEQLSGVAEIVNGTSARNSPTPSIPSGNSEAVERNAAINAEALSRAAARNRESR